MSETVLYGIDAPPGSEGVFDIDPITGNITVGANGSSRLVVRNGVPTSFAFDAFAYFLSSGPTGNRVSHLDSVFRTIYLILFDVGLPSSDCYCCGFQ